ncbi:MAG: AAA family ATPase, partial [Thermotogae bacterium]|nr:AAA family ATPase [Thermotogota bacterium]
QIYLSGGERTAMYLSYIMALREIIGGEVGEAPILLLDEPTVHLDSKRRRDVWEMVDRLHRERKIQIIVVTHDEQSFQEVLGSSPHVRVIRL